MDKWEHWYSAKEKEGSWWVTSWCERAEQSNDLKMDDVKNIFVEKLNGAMEWCWRKSVIV